MKACAFSDPDNIFHDLDMTNPAKSPVSVVRPAGAAHGTPVRPAPSVGCDRAVMTSFAAVGEVPVRQVLYCDRYSRPPSGALVVSDGYPGHLLQLAVSGRVEYEVAGRTYLLRPGDLIWHHELETVKRRVLTGQWECYSVNFLAPDLPPPPFDRRVRHVSPAIERRFAALLAAWRQTAALPVVRLLRVHAALGELLADLLAGSSAPTPESGFRTDEPALLWWQIEERLRHKLAGPMTTRRIAEIAGYSFATVNSACHAATGQSPMKRFKHLRLSLARSLVERSRMKFWEIAEHVGYELQHQFSRDYHKAFGAAPRDHRRAAAGQGPEGGGDRRSQAQAQRRGG